MDPDGNGGIAMVAFHLRSGHVPYMTPQWHRAIRHRNRLWHKYKQDHNITSWTLYKKQRNLCTSLRRKAIAQYFQHKADGCSTKLKDFWNFSGSHFHSRKGLANDIVLQENDEFVTDKLTIANDYFVNICEHIPVPGPNFSSHSSILIINNSILGSSNSGNSSDGQFSFQTISASIVTDIVLSLSSSKATGCDNIPIRLIKDSITIISGTLSNLFNSSLSACTFPSCWKLGQVTPVFKHRHAMRAWAILWNVDNVDKTGRSEKMVEWWVIYLWCFSFLLWCWRSMSKMFFFIIIVV